MEIANLLVLIGVIYTCEGVSLKQPIYKPGEFPYTKCRQHFGTVNCETLNISKERREKESRWPPGPYAIPMARYGCPESASRGWTKGVIMTENDVDIWKLRFCVKSERNKNLDKGIWIPGDFNIYMSGKSCPEGFQKFERIRNISKLNAYGHVPNYKRFTNLNNSIDYVSLSLCERNATNMAADLDIVSPFSMLETFFVLEKTKDRDCPTTNGTSTGKETVPGDNENEYCLNIPVIMFEDNKVTSEGGLKGSGHRTDITSSEHNMGGMELLSGFDLTKEKSPVSDEDRENETDIVWYMFDMMRSLSVSKVEISRKDKNSDVVQFLRCFYGNVMPMSSDHDSFECDIETNHTSQALQFYLRNMEGRYLTLVFRETTDSTMRILAKFVKIFIQNLESLNGEVCNEDLGMKDGSIPDFQISASTWHPQDVPSAARPRSSGWCAKTSDRNPWILVDLIASTTVEGVSIWNKVKYRRQETDTYGNIWSFNLYYGTEMANLNIYNETTFHVYLDKPRSKAQTYLLPKPFIARYIKLEVWLGFYGVKRCLSLEIQGCKLSGVPSLNCHNTSEMFDLMTEVRTAQSTVILKNDSSTDDCRDLCLGNDTCSVAHYSEDGQCLQYMSSPLGIWQVNDIVNGSWSAALCATDSIQFFPRFRDYDGTVTSNIQRIENTAIITTIGYPFTYGSGQEYKWMINFSKQDYITMIFTNVSMGSKLKSQKHDTPYSCDRLFISKKIETRPKGKAIDHLFNGRIFVVETGESMLFLSFTSCPSAKLITANRFRAIVSKKEIPACLSIHSKQTWRKLRTEICKKPNMMITSMSILNIPFENKEKWSIYAGNHNSVQMEFVYFYVLCPEEVSGNASTFKIVDNPNNKTYCNTDMPPKIFHSKNSDVTVIFRKYADPPEMITRREGFRLRYNTISQSLENLTNTPVTAIEFETSSFDAVNKVCSTTFQKCYFVFSSMCSCSEAGSTCWKYNMKLVSIRSNTELQYVHYLLRDLRYRETGSNATKGAQENTFAHIGLYRLRDEQKKKKYVWQNSSPVTFFAWSPENPSDGDCTRTNFRHFNTDNIWESEDCNKGKAQYFICEINIGDENVELGKKKICGTASLANHPKMQVTYSGKVCQYWNSLSSDVLRSSFYKPSVHSLRSVTSNFCQDPTSYGMLWCYTNDSNILWEPCFFQGEKKETNEFKTSISRPTDKFECDNGTFIPVGKRCDGIFDCRDLTDEVRCQEVIKNHFLLDTENKSPSQKPPTKLELGSYYLCGSKEWISVIAKCDGVIDCLDASDEVNCVRSQGECKENEFSCTDGTCIHASQVCDYIPDCDNASDELCEFKPCALEEFTCDNKQCIDIGKRCSGIPDCIDESDEMSCAFCTEDAFHCDMYKCIQKRFVCDKFPDCDDKSDESSCHIGTLSSCDEWWERGYHTSGQYIIDGMAVNCDFSSVDADDKKIRMEIRNIDLSYTHYGTLYTRSSVDSKLLLNKFQSGKQFRNLIFRKDYECLLEMKSSCHFPEEEASVFDDPRGNFVFKHCHCTVNQFQAKMHTVKIDRATYCRRRGGRLVQIGSTLRCRKIPYVLTRRRRSLYTRGQFVKIRRYNFEALPPKQCTGGILPQRNISTTKFFEVNNMRTFTVDSRILNNEIPVEIKTGPITCTYKYTPTKQENLTKCDGNEPKSMLCVYDVDVYGNTTGCRSGSHLQFCDNITCPENTVKCPGSYCIPLKFVCDGTVHCPRGEDERGCFCTDSGREIVILTEDTSLHSGSKTAAAMLARQFYTPGSIIRVLHYKARRLKEIPLKNQRLEIHEEVVYPYETLNRMPECRYKTMARHLLHSIKFSSKGPNGLVFIEDSIKSSRVAKIMFSNISNSMFTIYRVKRSTTPFQRKVKHVENVQISDWRSLSSFGFKRFPEICKVGSNVPCIGAYRCLSSKQCIPLEQVCDGIVQCRNADDERLCDFRCPEKCNCDGLVVSCRSAGINESNIKVLAVNTRSLDVSHNAGLRNVLSQDYLSFPYLLRMNLSVCEIKSVDSSAFSNLNNLRSLDLGYNQIVELPDKIFSNLYHLTHLNLDGNFELTKISPTAFHGLRSIRNLRISGTKLKRISAFTFSGLTLQSITISNNRITEIEDNAFNNISVKTIDFTHNTIVKFNKLIFNNVTSLQELHTPAFKFCCVRPCYVSGNKCFPSENEFSSCDDLMRHPVLQAMLWIVGIASLFGNFGSIMYRLIYDRERLKIGYGIFVTNLAAADFLMGVYLIMIATVDSLYRKRYIFFDEQWRNSKWCDTAGILSTVSSEASVIFVCLITLDRLLVIKYPFGTLRFEPSKAYLCCGISWVVSFTLAFIPVIFTSYFERRFYSRSAVCIALPLTRDKPPGWMYSVLIFVGLNFCTFIVVAFGQLSIFLELRKSTGGVKNTQNSRRRDLRVARNLVLVATTDFLCWFPIGLMGIMALNGYPIPGDVYAWTAVFILPLNSALNPFLYTLSAIVGKQSFNPSIDEQSRVDTQKDIGVMVLQYQRLTRFVRTTSEGARIGQARRLHDFLKEEKYISVGSTEKIALLLAKYLCVLHESSVGVEKLSDKDTYLRFDKKKRQIRNIILDTETTLLSDKAKMRDNIYQFGQLLNKMIVSCNKKR